MCSGGRSIYFPLKMHIQGEDLLIPRGKYSESRRKVLKLVKFFGHASTDTKFQISELKCSESSKISFNLQVNLLPTAISKSQITGNGNAVPLLFTSFGPQSLKSYKFTPKIKISNNVRKCKFFYIFYFKWCLSGLCFREHIYNSIKINFSG